MSVGVVVSAIQTVYSPKFTPLATTNHILILPDPINVKLMRQLGN